MPGEKKNLDYCAVPDCHKYRDDNVSLHRFPKDLELRKLWLDAANLKTCSNASRICSDHFLPDDFHLPGISTMRKRLRLNIIPTVNLPNSHEYQKTICQPIILRKKTCKLKKNSQKKIVDENHLLESNPTGPDEIIDSSSQSCDDSQQ